LGAARAVLCGFSIPIALSTRCAGFAAAAATGAMMEAAAPCGARVSTVDPTETPTGGRGGDPAAGGAALGATAGAGFAAEMGGGALGKSLATMASGSRGTIASLSAETIGCIMRKLRVREQCPKNRHPHKQAASMMVKCDDILIGNTFLSFGAVCSLSFG
jgi:hypothetical protein